ncbi:hypothetical protein ACLB2K_059009 [Fragaria x ananassa]
MGEPGKEHWQAVKRLFRYLKGTSDVGLIYGGDTKCLVTGYSDSDYAGDVDTRRSMTGYVFTLGGSVVIWKATLQPTVTLSTTEAEYMALTAAAKEGIWLKGLVSSLGLHHDQAIVYCDCLSAICLAKDQVHHERTKHIDVSITVYPKTQLEDIVNSKALIQLKLSRGSIGIEKADLVVKLLKHYGCSDTLVSKIVRKGPKLLVFNAQKTLLPKLEFFASIGISGTALAGVLSMNPTVLQLSLENTLRPCYRITKTLLIPPERLPCFFRDFSRIALGKLCIVASNTSILRAHGVPESSFPLWVPFHFNALSFDSDKVKENVKKVRSMGFQPLSATFMKALYVISVTNASKWQQKMDLYRKWGLTEDDVLSAFRKYPFMNFSEKIISSKMDFVVNSMGCQPSYVAACPDVLCYSLEKQIIPRCSVIRLLQVEGLIAKEDVSIQNILKCNEESFFKSHPCSLLGSTQDEKSRSFTVSYLVNSLGFSPEKALSASKNKKLHFDTPEQPDSVVKLLKHYGLTDTHISNIVKTLPVLLVYNAEKTPFPKLQFFCSVGLSSNDLARILRFNANILTWRLERSIKPCYDIMKTLGIPKHKLPESSFPLWVSFYFKALSFDSEKVKENVKKIMSMGFQPSSSTFMKALYVISVTDASKWEHKMKFYKMWGWTEDDVLSAFRKTPPVYDLL